MLATYRTSFAPIDASAKTWITTSLVPSLGVLACRLLRIRITQPAAPGSAARGVSGLPAREGRGPGLAWRQGRRGPRPRRVGGGERGGIRGAAADDLPHLRRPPGVTIRPPRRLERIAPEVRRRERERIE